MKLNDSDFLRSNCQIVFHWLLRFHKIISHSKTIWKVQDGNALNLKQMSDFMIHCHLCVFFGVLTNEKHA